MANRFELTAGVRTGRKPRRANRAAGLRQLNARKRPAVKPRDRLALRTAARMAATQQD